jgi:hypothetical protein
MMENEINISSNIIITDLQDMFKFRCICEIKAHNLIKMNQASPRRHVLESIRKDEKIVN